MNTVWFIIFVLLLLSDVRFLVVKRNNFKGDLS